MEGSKVVAPNQGQHLFDQSSMPCTDCKSQGGRNIASVQRGLRWMIRLAEGQEEIDYQRTPLDVNTSSSQHARIARCWEAWVGMAQRRQCPVIVGDD